MDGKKLADTLWQIRYGINVWDDIESGLRYEVQDVFDKLESRLEKQAEIIAVMREALEFYAERDNYDREGVLYADHEHTVDYGYKAGQALAKAEGMLK